MLTRHLQVDEQKSTNLQFIFGERHGVTRRHEGLQVRATFVYEGKLVVITGGSARLGVMPLPSTLAKPSTCAASSRFG